MTPSLSPSPSLSLSPSLSPSPSLSLSPSLPLSPSLSLSLPAIKQRVPNLSLAEVEAILAPPSATRPAPPEPTYAAERWERVVLVPGLEIHVNGAGGPILRRMAQEIVSYFGGSAGRATG